jgi:AraC-like DNA-binding protein
MKTTQATKFWFVPELQNLELFRASAIHYNYARHSHAGYSIGVIEAGIGGNYYRGSTYLAPPKSIVFMNPEEVHTGYSAEELPLTYRMMYPGISLIHSLADELETKASPYFKDAVVQNEELAAKIVVLHTVLEQSRDRLEQQSWLVEVLSDVLTQYANYEERSPRSGAEHRAVRLVKEYLYDHFSTPVSLQQLVELTNLNQAYLIRVFRQAVGMPPYTYLNQIRIEQAKQLLAQGMAVAEVAIVVGMADQSHLTRHFKRIVGVTPGYYRTMSLSFKTK